MTPGENSTFVRSLDGTYSQKLADGNWHSLSKDGTRLAYAVGKDLHVLDLSSGQDSMVGTSGTGGVGMIWSPNGTRILYTDIESLFVINADGSERKKVDDGLEIAVVGWLPDSQTVIYAVRGDNGFGLKSYHLQTGERRDHFTFDNKCGFAAISPDGQWVSFADRVFGLFPYGIFVSRLDGSERRLIADPELISMYKTVWSPNGQ